MKTEGFHSYRLVYISRLAALTKTEVVLFYDLIRGDQRRPLVLHQGFMGSTEGLASYAWSGYVHFLF